jgi:hypothetical protein
MIVTGQSKKGLVASATVFGSSLHRVTSMQSDHEQYLIIAAFYFIFVGGITEPFDRRHNYHTLSEGLTNGMNT